jgi:hypothetical protein
MKHRLCASLAAVVLMITASTIALAGTEVVEGIALRLPERTEIYHETHEISALHHRISYSDLNGVLLAKKQLDYTCSDSAPAWEQHDLRSGKVVGGYWAGEDYMLVKDGRETAIRPEGTLVASSGFDRFVRKHRDSLLAGDTIGFEFALPARLSTIDMRIRREENAIAESGIADWFRVEPVQGLFRLFTSGILLGYSESGELLLYRGPSNISDGEGGDLDVEIRYHRHTLDSEAGKPAETAPATALVNSSSTCPRQNT